MKKIVVCLTGGVDSTVTAAYLKKIEEVDIYPVFFDYGQKACAQEKKAVTFFTKYLRIRKEKIIKIPYTDKISHPHICKIEIPHFEESDLYDHSKHIKIAQADFVPYRNLSFAVLAAIYAEVINAKEVVFGFNADSTLETCPDATEEFLKSVQILLNLSTLDREPVVVVAPLINCKKSKIVEIGTQLEIPFEKTYSCFRGGERHCGRCEGCVKRKLAFQEIGIIDTTIYEVCK